MSLEVRSLIAELELLQTKAAELGLVLLNGRVGALSESGLYDGLFLSTGIGVFQDVRNVKKSTWGE